MSWDDVVETFDLMDDWEDRYRFIIDLGRKLPALPDDAYDDAHKVRGCQSQVWMLFDRTDGDRIDIRGDSDAHIVKGLIALLLLIYSGRSAAEIRATDARNQFQALDLEGHLSAQRANGLFAMVQRINDTAAAQPAN
ncbi:cysteine desufuration protein SufE [Rhodothalassium salexigens]|nr:cysteine desulfuration protein SufE [Rhodothalassium salexigens DSM 2132]MBK5910831.1 cysteine desufuration protein SufE [Rhodothalassium salexigens]MBK5921105.1 cysteine desufuration protein SufE [Rhodothalassium salexigens]